jgi:hypothetical protein
LTSLRAGWVLAVLAGCAPILTQSQIDAAHQLAEESRAYAQLPPDVLIAFGDARAGRESLHLAAGTYGNPAAGNEAAAKLDATVAAREALDSNINALRAALQVLVRYAALLETLSSDQAEATLDKPFETFGNSLDDAVSAYNASKGAALPAFGSAAAAVARAAGGVILRVRQAEFVKAYVEKADPVVQVLAQEIAALLAPFATAAGDDGQFANELKALAASFHLATLRSQLSFDEVDAYYRMQRTDLAGRRLADRAISASKAFAVAHAKLRASLAEPLDLSVGLEELKSFAKEVTAATDVKAEVDLGRR